MSLAGPFYVIVEYCEHGCLLKYLRRSRLEENGYVNQKVRYRYQSPNLKEQTDPNLRGDLLTMRDLLSFAWQIAKGMSYLSSIKVRTLIFSNQGPVVQTIISLTSSVRGQLVKCFTTLQPNTLKFFVEKMREASQIFSTKILAYLRN